MSKQGEEFAINLVASPTTPRGVQVTDVWLYHKLNTDGVSCFLDDVYDSLQQH
jgi:hypothetical protein